MVKLKNNAPEDVVSKKKKKATNLQSFPKGELKFPSFLCGEFITIGGCQVLVVHVVSVM